MIQFKDPYELAKYIKDATKQTIVKIYLNGTIEDNDFKQAKIFGSNKSYIIIGNFKDLKDCLSKYSE
ncbi:MAG: 2,3,4,5-tetrahydropyridine-2,6-dicarboxylate N-acetyltransferase, partial [Bacilli bacterium]